MSRFLFFLACLYILPAQALPNMCMQGHWRYDKDKSDNSEQLLKKLVKKQKQEDRQLHYINRSLGAEKEDLTLPDKIPSFVFQDDDMTMKIEKSIVTIQFSDNQRRIFIDKPVSISLATLDKNNEQVIASWEKNSLLVETTFPSGSHIIEQFQLSNVSTLRVNTTISFPFAKKKTALHKEYTRLDLPALQCL